MNATPKPTWITLYSIGAIGMAALFFVPVLHVAPLMQTIIMLLIVIALYGAIGMWLSENSYALEVEDMEQMNATFKIQWDVMREPVQADNPISDTETDVPQTHDHQEAA